MTVQYVHMGYEEYKSLEAQMRDFKETTHKTEGGFYHKSIRLRIGDLIVEYHGPLVGGYGHNDEAEAKRLVPRMPGNNDPQSCDFCGSMVTVGRLLPCLQGPDDPIMDGCPYGNKTFEAGDRS